MLASLFLIGAIWSTPQMSVQAASQTIVEDGIDGMTNAVNRMTGGIITYARWPGPAESHRTFCLVGTPQLTARVAPDLPGNGPRITVRRTTPGAVISNGDCDILFLGRLPIADRQRLIGWVRGRPVLTISDDDPACLYGAMFCLAEKPAGLSFSVNLDSIGRGPLRVDPRVLKIGHADGGTP
ncbi:YfiR family protein [Sphingopyxis sp. OPL5]|uniref:YfiR family protein n=1 Tax=Sphingopyxis sp. OPL5 TaxID=2486273 RepID=UPI00164E1A7B|nr:YfiR family protein [Sphingopyxis sp. OPL5]QNO28661.1 YfiR family protein [Sphingopyxis sp. OPL5]